MRTHELVVVDGPIEADLLHAMAHPDEQLVFRTKSDVVDAQLERMERGAADLPDFVLQGHLTSGKYRGAAFNGIYHPSSRTGLLQLVL